MNMVTVATFNELKHAEPLGKRLEQAGIKAEIYDERKLQKYWFLSETLAGIRLRVDKQDFETAKNLLEKWDAADGALQRAIHCPACKSSRVEYPQFTRKFLSPSLYALLCKIGLFEKKFYCEECHFTWPIQEKLEPQTDVLGWPKK